MLSRRENSIEKEKLNNSAEMNYNIPELPLKIDVESKRVLRQLNAANRKLAELKGMAQTIPNENILINTLVLQEAKESSAIENIVTTHDELYKAGSFRELALSSSAKEVLQYSDALKRGFYSIRENKIISLKIIKEIQAILEQNDAGFRSVPGTHLRDQHKDIVYSPPQSKLEIETYMSNLEIFINDDECSDLDPLIKMAIIHHQFESIHPFYDGNGRTGRILNILYLVSKDLLDLPILYLSRYIIRTKSEYYRIIQAVRENGNWEEWIMYILIGIEQTSSETIELVGQISKLMQGYKQVMRPLFGKSYRHEMLNNIFNHPYTQIDFLVNDLGVNRKTASDYLNKMVDNNLLRKVKISRTNYYLNIDLIDLFLTNSMSNNSDDNIIQIESISQ